MVVADLPGVHAQALTGRRLVGRPIAKQTQHRRAESLSARLAVGVLSR